MKKPLLAAGIILLCLFIGISVVDVEVFSRANGIIAPTTKAVKVGVAQPGVVTDIYVNKGEVVRKNTLLAAVDSEEIRLNIKNLKAQIKNAKHKLTILEGLIKGHKLKPPLKSTIIHDLSNQHIDYLKDLNELISFHHEEKGIIDGLVAKSTLPKIKAIEINQKLLKDKKEINKTTKEFWERVVFDAEQQRALIVRLQSLMLLDQHKLKHTKIYSNYDGIIQKINFSKGEYIARGDSFAEIIPNHEQIKAKILISPDDIGGIKVGQQVKIQVETFNYKIYGTSDAKISYISPDAIEETVTGKYYLAECTLGKNYIEKDGKKFQLKSGMPIVASIVRGHVSAFNYFIGPLIRSFHLVGVV